MTRRQRRRQLCQRCVTDRQLGILAVKHHRTLILLITVDAQRAAEPVITAEDAVRQRGGQHTEGKIDLAVVQRL